MRRAMSRSTDHLPLLVITVAASAVAAILAVAYVFFPRVEDRRIEVKTVLSAKPTADELRRVFQNVVPMGRKPKVENGRPYDCFYVDDTHSDEALAWDVQVLWCQYAPERVKAPGAPSS